MNDIIQLKITIQDSAPPIWRQILVDKDITLYTLHTIIQVIMGWDNSHLFQFKVGKRTFSIPYDDDFDDEDNEDALEVKVEDIVSKAKQKFKYEYDFGDNWIHIIEVEKFLPRENTTQYPFCIEGKLKGPPEDSGGIYGYYRMLEIINSKQHPEKEDILEWLGGEFDPEYFDLDSINEEIGKLG